MSQCPICGEATIYDGQRRYWPEGFPYVHTCEVVNRIPNEGDFCAICSMLTWGEPCSDCKARPAPKKARVSLQLHSRPVAEGLDL